MIPHECRRNIFHQLEMENFYWAGRMSDLDFLSRLYDLKSLPSHDGRFADAAGDIWQHTVMNSDYEGYWVVADSRFDLLKCPDETFLRFLCEIVHPLVRPDTADAAKIITITNDWLRPEGWELAERTRVGGKPIFSARPSGIGSKIAVSRARQVADQLGSDYVAQQITRMEIAVESDPELAIGTAKEFVETICKSVLDSVKIEHHRLEFPQLVKTTLKQLKLTPESIREEAKAVATIRVLLNNLAAISSGLTELRNWYGTGHGKSAGANGLQSRHARLAVGAASTLALFILDTTAQRSHPASMERL